MDPAQPDRVPVIAARVWPAIGFGAALVGAIALSHVFYRPLWFHSDPDDMLRLLQVRDWLGGQGWFDVRQYRIAPPDGLAMHWSRIVDLPLAASMVAMRAFVDPAQAEMIAVLAVPVATGIALLVLAWRATRALFPSAVHAAPVAAVLLALNPAIVEQVHPARIDHHGWQLVLAVAALLLWAMRDRRWSAAALGAVLALWLAISLEGLPMSAAFLALLAWQALRDPALQVRFAHAALGLALASMVLALAAPPALPQWCDVVGPGHLGAMAVVAAGGMLVARFAFSARAMLIGYGATAVLALAALAFIAPQCLAPPLAGVDPLVQSLWFDRVLQGLPIWDRAGQNPASIVLYFWMPVIAIGGLGAAVLRGESDAFAYLLLLLAALFAACMVTRSVAIAAALSAPALGWLVAHWGGALIRAGVLAERLAGGLLVFLAVSAWLPTLAVASMAPPDAPAGRCALAASGIAQWPAGLVLAPLNLAAPILATSEHAILASGHHRGSDAMTQALTMMVARPDAAVAAMRARDVDYLVVCFDEAEALEYRESAPTGLIAALHEGKTVAGLTTIDTPADSGVSAWRVAP